MPRRAARGEPAAELRGGDRGRVRRSSCRVRRGPGCRARWRGCRRSQEPPPPPPSMSAPGRGRAGGEAGAPAHHGGWPPDAVRTNRDRVADRVAELSKTQAARWSAFSESTRRRAAPRVQALVGGVFQEASGFRGPAPDRSECRSAARRAVNRSAQSWPRWVGRTGASMSTCEPSWSASATGVLIRSRPASSTGWFHCPRACRFPSRVRNMPRSRAVLPHTARSSAIVEVITGAPQPLPAHRDRWAARRQRLLRGAKLGPQQRKPAGQRTARRRCETHADAADGRQRRLLGVHQVQLAGPKRAAGRQHRDSWRRSATCAANARIPNRYWSSIARVIAPAHRLDAAAVTERLRCRRTPHATHDPAGPGPPGPPTLCGTANREVRSLSTLPSHPRSHESGYGSAPPTAPRPRPDHNRAHPTALTHTPHPDSHNRHRPTPTRALLTTARYHSLRLTIRPALRNPVDHGGDARSITGR